MRVVQLPASGRRATIVEPVIRQLDREIELISPTSSSYKTRLKRRSDPILRHAEVFLS